MQHSREHHLKSIAALTAVLSLVFVGNEYQQRHGSGSLHSMGMEWQARLGNVRSMSLFRRSAKNATPQERIALRLQRRLRDSSTLAAPPLKELTKAVEQRQQLLTRHFRILFSTEEDAEYIAWDVSAQRYPLWIKPTFTLKTASYTLNTTAIQQTLSTEEVIKVQAPVHAVLQSVTWKDDADDETVSRAQIDGVARSGYLPDMEETAQAIALAFHSEDESVSIPLKKIPGRIINTTGEDLGELVLWGQGRSDYTGSTYARSKNVYKALNQHVNNVVVRPGEKFSFNATLDGPVTQGNGWYMAKVIFNGADLEYAPGGGICQASTTVYRAIVNAGFPVEERRAHSLYVSYYEKHGVGIDATIFPGSQDLVFTNDTDNALIIQSYNDGMEAFVNIFGTPDGRTVELEGPFFATSAPADYQYLGRGLKKTEILWDHRVVYSDGTMRSEQIASRYRTLPQHLGSKYQPQETVHAAAPLASALD